MAKPEGESHKMKLEFPCTEEQFEEIREIISGLRDLSYEHLVAELNDYPNNLSFIQTARLPEDEDDPEKEYLIEAAFGTGTGEADDEEGEDDDINTILRYEGATEEETIEAFRKVCMEGQIPKEDDTWVNVTRKVLFERKTLNLFKAAYKVVRRNSDEIYKGFGFRHLSDATMYYVHPDNQSFRGTTTLCQPIGEAVILFATMLREIANGKEFGNYWFDENSDTAFLDIRIPEDYRANGVVEENIYRYRALLSGLQLTVGAYDRDDGFIPGDMEHLHPLYKLLPAFLATLAAECDLNQDYRMLFDKFWQDPANDTFVNVHEDLYQNHKMDEYSLGYLDVKDIDVTGWRSYAESYAVIRENKEESVRKVEKHILKFPAEAFSDEQKAWIPNLPSEFILPENMESVCSALASGDTLSVLFHGPAGTGKTISCKLVAQTIGLPIMETINCTENLDEFVLGKYIPEDDRIVFKESYVTKAIRDGGAVVFEEINFAKPQYLAFLNSLLDDNGFVRLDSGEVVKRNKNFRFFATMNMGYFGTKELNQALYNRFNIIVEVAALSDEAITRMLVTRVPECEPVVAKILGVYHKIKKKIEAEELDVVISPRNLENWVKLAKYDGYIKAAEKTIIPVAKCDRALEDTIRGIMMLYKWKE